VTERPNVAKVTGMVVAIAVAVAVAVSEMELEMAGPSRDAEVE
jgi:hypothetical protein